MRFAIVAVFTLCCLSSYCQMEKDDWLQNQRPEHIESYTTDASGTHKVAKRVGSLTSAAIKSKGKCKVPVVLVNYSDRKFTLGNTDSIPDSLVTDSMVNAYYTLFCNGTMDGKRYTGHGSYGSIRDYFVEMSDSAFLPEFKVIGPVTLNNGYAYYGKNNVGSKDNNYSAFCNEVMEKAVQQFEDWSEFDNNSSGDIDMVLFIYAGWGESNSHGLDPDAMWAKESTASTNVGGYIFANSACCHELRVNTSYPIYSYTYNAQGVATDSTLIDFGKRQADGSITGGSKPDGVGVFIHEFSHALGLPDFYDTNNVAFGMDIWSVMDYGEYGNNGFNPGGYNAYERNFMEWQELPELTEPQVLTLSCFADGGHGYKIVNQDNANEYYVIENRQPKGWDEKVCSIGHGLQVTHVDYNSSNWNANIVNTNASHQRMTIIAANNNYTGTNAATSSKEWKLTLSGNLYPGDHYNYDLTDESTPVAKVYTSNDASYFMHKPIRNITENEDGTITLCYMTNGQLEAPMVDEATDIEDHSFTANWQEVENATRYVIEMESENEYVRCDTIDGAESTSFLYDALRASAAYKYRVMALADSPYDYISSEWSDYQYVKTDEDCIKSVDDSEKIVSVYSMDGAPIRRCAVSEFHTLNLRPGVYVLKYDNGASRKVMMK